MLMLAPTATAPDSSTNGKASAADEQAVVRVMSMAGNVLGELRFGLAVTILELKKHIRPTLLPDASRSAKIMLLFDGIEPAESQNLGALGIVADEHVHFTVLIHDPELLAKKDMEEMYRHALERSREEAAAARKSRKEAKERALAQHKQQVEAEAAAEAGKEQGPMLMLADERAKLMLADERGAAGAQAETTQGPLLMLTAEPCAVAIGCTNETANGQAVAPSPAAGNWQPEAISVAAAYYGFFQHISFRKGWKEPSFTAAEAANAFVRGARIVALIRVEVLNRRDAGFKIRQVEGSAVDWMHSPECGQLLREQPDFFVVELVHATLKDGKGYVEGLTKGEVDEFVKLYS